MIKLNQHIEIVSSTVTGLSSMSQVSREAAREALGRHYNRAGITIVNDMNDLDALVAKAPDIVLLGMTYIYKNSQPSSPDDQKIWLADYLAEHNIATTGSSSRSHHLEQNKPLAKKYVSDAGLNTSDFYMVKVGEPLKTSQLPGEYPLFVKPANRGGGLGIDSDSVVYNLAELQDKVDSLARKLGADSLIETYLPGREFSVAILRDNELADYVCMPIELTPPQDERGVRILSGKVKSDIPVQPEMVRDAELRQSVVDLALGAFRAIGGRDYGRIDIRLDAHGVPHFLEANLIPSLIANYGSFPKACALYQDMTYEEMLLRIIDLGMARATPTDTPLRLAPHGTVVHSFG